MVNKPRHVPDPARLLSVEGHVIATPEFFAQVEQTVTSAVNAAVTAALGDSVRYNVPAQETEPVPCPAADISPEDRKKAAATLAASGLDLGLKEGQLLVDMKLLACMLNISSRSVWKLAAERALPAPIDLGMKVKRWRLEEILAWLHTGCPPQDKWDRMRKLAIRDYKEWLPNPKRGTSGRV